MILQMSKIGFVNNAHFPKSGHIYTLNYFYLLHTTLYDTAHVMAAGVQMLCLLLQNYCATAWLMMSQNCPMMSVASV